MSRPIKLDGHKNASIEAHTHTIHPSVCRLSPISPLSPSCLFVSRLLASTDNIICVYMMRSILFGYGLSASNNKNSHENDRFHKYSSKYQYYHKFPLKFVSNNIYRILKAFKNIIFIEWVLFVFYQS